MRLFAVSLTLILGFIISADASATNCRQRVVQQNQVHHQAVAVVPYAAVLSLPAYSAAYAPDDGLADKVKSLQEQLDRIEKLLSGQKPVPQPPPLKAQITPDQQALTAMFQTVKRACAACHSDTAASQGGGLVMLRGNALVKPTEKQAWKILTRTFDPDAPDAMPPLSAKKKFGIEPLTDADYAALNRGIAVLMSR